MAALTEQGGVHVLALGDGENRCTHEWLAEVGAALDEVVAAPAPLVTAAGGKHCSTGLDVDWTAASPDELSAYTARGQALFAAS